MPSYVIEFDSNHGPERRLFTLDDDRTLEIQLFQVLEELRQSGRVLQGAPGDELAVSWNNAELSMHAPLHALGVDASRPLVLRMRPRPIAVAPPPAKPRFTLRHMVLPPVEGALGALAAWGIGGMITDLRAPIASVDRADVAVAVLLAGAVGIALNAGSVLRGLCRAPAGVLYALLCVIAGALVLLAVGATGDVPTVRGFLFARIGAWMLIAIPVALLVTAPLRELGAHRFLESALVAAGAGILCALLASLPGVSDLWQAVAFVACGALVGGAAISIPVWRASSGVAR